MTTTAPADLWEQEVRTYSSLLEHGEISLTVSNAKILNDSVSTVRTTKRGRTLVNITLLLSTNETDETPLSS
jgi:hypothetical protein